MLGQGLENSLIIWDVVKKIQNTFSGLYILGFLTLKADEHRILQYVI